jgi:hypothetical protein
MLTIWGTPKSAKHRLGYYVPKYGTMDARVQGRPLDSNQMAKFESATKMVLDFVPILRTFEIAELSYQQVRAAIEEVDGRLRNIFGQPGGGIPLTYDSETFLQLRVMSFLFAARAFLDQTRTVFCHLFGSKSSEVAKFDENTHQLYDDNFSYRFLYKLRDMSQHVALPLSVFRVSYQRAGTEELVYESELKLDRDHLLRWKEWKAVRKDVEKQPAQFDLMPLVDQEMKWLGMLCYGVFADRVDGMREGLDYVSYQLNCMRTPPNAVPVLWVGDSIMGGPPSQSILLPLEQAHRIINICRTAW